MAKATFSQPSVRPRSTALLRCAVLLWTLAGLGLIFSGPAATVISGARWFLEYYAGVFSLVSLSITVMGGLVATDRMVLTIRHRILLQAAHRGTALASVAFLGIHITLKILEGHASLVDAVVPFLASHRVVFIGFGTIAGNLMVLIAWTGVIRGRFAGRAHPGLWRALHATAYVAWPFALLHGLQSGRPAKTWVTVSYVACVVFVVLALLVRLCLAWNKRRRAPMATTTGTIRAVGKPVPRAEPPRYATLPPLRQAPPSRRGAPARARRVPTPPRPEPVRMYAEPTLPDPEPTPVYTEPAPLYAKPAPPYQRPMPLYEDPTLLYPEPAVADPEPVLPAASRHAEPDPYRARGPVSRGRLAKGAMPAQAANAQPRHATDLTEPGMPRHRTPEEPVTVPPTSWRTQAAENASSLGIGRHSGEYQVLRRNGAYWQPPAWQPRALEAAPAHIDHDDPDVRHLDAQPYAWREEPVSSPAKRRRSHRRQDNIVELTELPDDSPATRRPAAVLTDEEFWTHMRGDLLR